jgi:hypothetical protein
MGFYPISTLNEPGFYYLESKAGWKKKTLGKEKKESIKKTAQGVSIQQL